MSLYRTIAGVLFATLVVAFVLPAIAFAQPTVYTDQTTFEAATGAVALAFPPDASTALPNHPYSFTDYSCGLEIDLPSGPSPIVNVEAPNAANATYPNCLVFVIGPGWNAPAGNIVPQPTSSTIVANGEDDLLLTFYVPVGAVGLKLLTNKLASEIVTLNYTDGSSESIGDGSLDTDINSWEFIGFTSTKPISSVLIDNAGGGTQNEGLYGISILPAVVDIDIKPCSDPNAVNLGSSGVVPVAILGSAYFDVSLVNPSTVKLAGLDVKTVGKTDKVLCNIEDVVGPWQSCGGDGYPDLVCHMQMSEVAPGDAIWTLDAFTYSGTPVTGSDSVKIVP